jgi:23S rRNA (uracil1939-C5)-methyltransferase
VTDASPRIELHVERMAYGADAIARSPEGKTVFVAGGVPGDQVLARVTESRAKFDRAVVEEVVEPSGLRVESACPYASVCGGCPWAGLERQAQLDAKRASVVDALVRIGHFDAGEAESLVGDCLAPSEPWGYRNKVELAFARRGRQATLGMHGPGEAGIVRVDRCLLLDRRHQGLVKSVSGALGYLAGSHGLDLERVGIRASDRTGSVEVALWTSPGPFPRSQVARVLSDAGRPTSVVRVMTKGPSKARRVAGVECLSGAGFWEERIGDERMRLSAPSFFQVSTKGAEALVRLVLEALEPGPDEVAMDLYCGVGTFTLPLARRCSFVDAVESYGPAVRDLRRNLDAASASNVEAIGGDADQEFPEDEADVVVVDPPRAGLAEGVVERLCAQPARAIAYVSCDPATLARDLSRFAARGRFAPRSVTPVDLFPQTFHVETVTLLAKER